jgi:hypothetical protein
MTTGSPQARYSENFIGLQTSFPGDAATMRKAASAAARKRGTSACAAEITVARSLGSRDLSSALRAPATSGHSMSRCTSGSACFASATKSAVSRKQCHASAAPEKTNRNLPSTPSSDRVFARVTGSGRNWVVFVPFGTTVIVSGRRWSRDTSSSRIASETHTVWSATRAATLSLFATNQSLARRGMDRRTTMRSWANPRQSQMAGARRRRFRSRAASAACD